MSQLDPWGWDEQWEALLRASIASKLMPARIISEHRGLYSVITEIGEHRARIPGAMRHKAAEKTELPAVGDWIALELPSGQKTGIIRQILPRRTKLSRKAAGEVIAEQIIATNLDTVFVMTALNQDFNSRRLERFLIVCRDSGAQSVILLNKLDSCPDESPYKSQAIAIAGDVPIVSISAKTGVNVDRLSEWIKSGRTVGLIGSSGVGKSTLINRLIASSDIPTAQTRSSDERGRHTTTRREMYLVPGGGILMDTPGMREMQLWDTEKGMSDTFPEIDSLAQSCRFKDCAHNAEPGCAVKEGLTSGAVTPQRLASWQKLQGELKDRREIAMKKNWNNPPKAGGR